MGRNASSGALTESIYYILLRLHRPAHGYALMKDIAEMTDNRVRLGAGSLYGALDTLQKKGWIKALEEHPQDRKIEYIITATGKEYRLREALEPVYDLYDYIVIDTPPALGILTVNALTACTGAIIPAQADVYSLQGIALLSQTIETVRKYCNRALKIKGIVLTRYNSRAVLSRDMADLIAQTAQQLRTKLYTTRIRECTALKEAQAVQQDIFTYAPRSNAAADYKALVAEVLEGEV